MMLRTLPPPWKLFVRQYTKLPMPALSPTMTSGRVSSWKKKDGESFKVDDVLCEVETDKAVVDYSAVEEGVLAKILIKEGGDPVPVGITLAIIVENASEISKAIAEFQKTENSTSSAKQPAPDSKSEDKKASQPKAKPESEPAHAADSSTKNVTLSPAARSILGEDIDISKVHGSGRDGRIMKEDAVLFVSHSHSDPKASTTVAAQSTKSGASTSLKKSVVAVKELMHDKTPAHAYWLPVSRGPFRDVPLSTMRRVIAQRLGEAKGKVPHAYATIEADIGQALETRASMKKMGNSTLPSINDFVVKACALALLKVPNVNVHVENDTVKANKAVDISVAVATPGGLITPIIDGADKKNLYEISFKMKDLAKRAKENKLKLAEFQGGSFTVSNLGMFGIDDFTAIMNPPQVAILAVGGGKRELSTSHPQSVFELDSNKLQVRSMMTVTLSYDARVINDATAGKFLQSFQSYMESPVSLF